MTNREGILKSIQFMEASLREDISVLEVSREVGYSLYHFIRLFQNITGYSPKSYLQQRRLSEAAMDLHQTKKKAVEIAYDYQFGSPESFSRAFRRQFHISPLEVRKGLSLTALPLLRPLTSRSINQAARLRNEQPKLVVLQEKSLVGTSFFVGNDQEVNDLSREWTLFTNEVQSIEHLIHPVQFYQVQYWSDHQDLDGMYLFIGAEVSKIQDVNPLFVVKLIPRGQYLRFVHKGLANEVRYTYEFIYHQFLPNTEYRLNEPFNFEHYGEKCTGPYDKNSESEVYIPVGQAQI